MKAGHTFSFVQGEETVRSIDMRPGVVPLNALRNGVTEAIVLLGTGFFTHRANADLRDALQDGMLGKQEFYRQLLRLLYRLMILSITEERNLLLIFHYSIYLFLIIHQNHEMLIKE